VGRADGGRLAARRAAPPGREGETPREGGAEGGRAMTATAQPSANGAAVSDQEVRARLRRDAEAEEAVAARYRRDAAANPRDANSLNIVAGLKEANAARYRRVIEGGRGADPQTYDLALWAVQRQAPPRAGRGAGAAVPAAGDAGGYQFEVLDAARFDAKDYRVEWLVKGLAARLLPCVAGGPRKALKTSLLLDLALSLGAGAPFLGRFEVPKVCRTAFLSAESGPWALQETARRVCAAKGVRLAAADVLFGFDLPHLASPKDLEEFGDGLAGCAAEVVVLDPLYVALLCGEEARYLEASNLFDMGPLLRRVAQVCLDAGCTPVLAHHSVKRLANPNDPLDMEDLAFAGIQEFMRQWVLINRREPFDPDRPGSHRLWVGVGSSLGVSKLLAVDVEEGELLDDFGGRKWEVTVQGGGEARRSAAEQLEAERGRRQKEEARGDGSAVLVKLDELARGDEFIGYARLQAAARLSRDRMTRAVLDLVRDGVVEEGRAETWKGRNNKVKGTCHGLRRTNRTNRSTG
jgi:replicative DNA helicase